MDAQCVDIIQQLLRLYASTAHDRWMISSIWCYHSRDLDCSRPILLLLLLLLLAGWSLPDGLRRCCCRVNLTLFSRVTNYKAAIDIGPRPFSCSWTIVFTCNGTAADRQTDTQTRVTTIHFASSTTHAKCNYYANVTATIAFYYSVLVQHIL